MRLGVASSPYLTHAKFGKEPWKVVPIQIIMFTLCKFYAYTLCPSWVLKWTFSSSCWGDLTCCWWLVKGSLSQKLVICTRTYGFYVFKVKVYQLPLELGFSLLTVHGTIQLEISLTETIFKWINTVYFQLFIISYKNYPPTPWKNIIVKQVKLTEIS